MASSTFTDTGTDLKEVCGGAVHLPGDPGYDQARSLWNIAADVRPAAVAFPRDAGDVSEMIRAAGRHGLRVAPISTGHLGMAFHGVDLSDVVLLRMSGLSGVEIDAASGTARIQGGTLWQPVVEAAAAHGLAAMHGSSPDIAAAGYLLSGGLGWYARRHGLACNSVRSVDLVTADGDLLHVDERTEPELLWALRGGGGNFGVVTALEIDLLPYAQVSAGMLVWDQSRAADVLPAWLEWARTAPDEVTTSLRLLNLPPLPEIPAPLRGRRLVTDGVALLDDADADAVLAPLRACGPGLDTWGPTPAAGLTRLHLDPEGPTPGVGADVLLGAPTEGFVEAFLTASTRPGSPLLVAELRQLGGALARRDPARAALSGLDGDLACFAAAIAATPEMAQAGKAAAQDVMGALTPWAVPHRYLNFVEEPASAEVGFDEVTWQRLVALKQRWDPAGTLLAAHPIG